MSGVDTYTRTFAIRYLMRYRYESPVIDNLNVLRVTPKTGGSQVCEDVQVLVAPEARLHRHNDYYGTQVLEFGIERPHSELAIDVRSHVRTELPPRPPEESWAPTESEVYLEAGAEYLLPGDDRLPPGDLDDLIRHTRATTPLATVRLVCELIPDRFEYRAGATYVGSTVADLLRAGAGVCQDFVNLALLLLREQGIAARYVSGYLWVAARRTAAAIRPRSRPTRGSRRWCPTRAARATRSGSAPTRPTAAWSASTTSRSATAAATPTCRRSRASTAAWRRPSPRPRSRCGGWTGEAGGPARH